MKIIQLIDLHGGGRVPPTIIALTDTGDVFAASVAGMVVGEGYWKKLPELPQE